jgi:hypothetical protein
VVLALLLRRRWRDSGLVVGVAAAALVPWQLWLGAHAGALPPELVGKYGEYGGWMLDGYRTGGLPFARDVLAINVRELADALVAPFALGDTPALRWVAGVALVATAGAGAAPFARRAPVTAGMLACYLIIVAVWPFEPHRFVWAVWPLLVLVVVHGASGVTASLAGRVGCSSGRRVALGAAAAAALLVGAGYAAATARGVAHRRWEGVPRATAENAMPLARWVAEHTRPDDVVIADNEMAVHLYTGRRTLPTGVVSAADRVRPISREAAMDAMRALVRRSGARWVLTVYDTPTLAAIELTRGESPELRLVAALERGAAFEVLAR